MMRAIEPAVIDESVARALLPRRSVGAHKWGVGGVVIVAGAPWYQGAAILCSMAAGRAGAGIINLAAPPAVVSALTVLAPETAIIPIDENDPEHAAAEIAKRAARATALVVGPGLGIRSFTDDLLALLFGFAGSKPAVAGASKPAVVDADGLNWLSRQPEWWTRVEPGSLVLTPHLGEMSRLTGRSTSELADEDPAVLTLTTAATWRQTVVLKYGHTCVSDGVRIAVAQDAPPSLATAGSGDVLAGTIGAFLAQGLAPFDAAQLALYVGPRAARRVERDTGTLGLIASDLPLATARELANLEHDLEREDE